MASDTITQLVSAVHENPYGFSGLPKEDMLAAWHAIGTVIRDDMKAGKGVNVAGLGAFTCTSQRVELGNRYKVITTPAFYLAERFARTHGVRSKKPNPTGAYPVVELNMSRVAQIAGLSRAVVTGVLKDVLVVVADYVHMSKACELDVGVGRLVFRGGQAVMRWNQSIVDGFDRTNQNYIDTARPVTASGAARNEGARPPRGMMSSQRPLTMTSSMYRPQSASAGARPQSAGGRPSSASRGLVPLDSHRPASRGNDFGNGLGQTAPHPPSHAPSNGLGVSGNQVPLEDRKRGPSPRPASGGSHAGHAHGPVGRRGSDVGTRSIGPHEHMYNTQGLCKICQGRELATLTKRNLQAREADMDHKILEMLERDALLAQEQDKQARADQRAKTKAMQEYNLALAADRDKQREYLAEWERGMGEEPVLGNRPTTPPPAVRAAEYSKMLGDQVANRTARRQRAIDEEVAQAAVAQKILDKHLEEERRDLEERRARQRNEMQDALATQVRMKQIQRERDMVGDDEEKWGPLVNRPDSPSQAAARRAERQRLHEDQMGHLTMRRNDEARQKALDLENERAQLEEIQRQVAEGRNKERDAAARTRRGLESSWEDQMRVRGAMAALDAPHGPMCTSLAMPCEADDRGEKCIRCGRPMPDGIAIRNPWNNSTSRPSTATNRRSLRLY